MGSRGAKPESAPPIGEGEAAAPPGDGVAVYLSSILGPPPRTSAALAGFLGFTDYSYSFSMQGYIDAFEALGLECALLNAVQNIGDVGLVSTAPANLHFGFYPPDKPRLLKGAYNVFVMAWEFERLRLGHENLAHHAFADPVRMMNLADEVWMVSHFGADAAARSGVANVRAVASPVLKGVSDKARQAVPGAGAVLENAGRLDRVEWVPLAVAPIFQPVLTLEAGRRRRTLGSLLREGSGGGSPTVFLTVFNIADWRKQVLPLLEAFVRFAAVHPNAFLLLKLNSAKDQSTDLNFELLCQQIAISGELAPPLVSDRIWLTSEPLDREELDSLYDLAAFYVCTSHGEGQNLPLIEAMGRGAVALSVDHTAMADYLTSANAIVIPSTLGPFNARLRFRYEMGQISTYYVSAPDVQDALERAIALDPAAYASLSAAGLATVKDKFGLEPFRVAVEAAIARARAARSG